MSGAGCTCSQRPTDLASDALYEYACRRDGGESEIVAQMVDGESWWPPGIFDCIAKC
jgi:hypothetical protein